MTDLKRQHEELKREKKILANLLEIAKRRGFIDSDPINIPAIDATVQKVNRELKYVMLSVGSDDKVGKGYRFVVSRNGRYIGDVQVDYVKPRTCSASFVRVAPGFMFEIGDSASTRL